MLFEDKHYGSRISQELSMVLLRNSTVMDQHEAAEMTQGRVSRSTVRDVAYRRNPLTKNNAEGIVNLARIAFAKNMELKKLLDQDADFLLDELGESEEGILMKVNVESLI